MKAVMVTILGLVLGLVVPIEIGLPMILLWVFLVFIALEG